MKKTGYYLLALLFAALGILGLVLTGISGYAILLTIIAAPGFLVSLVLGVTAGRKDGDIPFVGY